MLSKNKGKYYNFNKFLKPCFFLELMKIPLKKKINLIKFEKKMEIIFKFYR
jgi:hypothetical protein